MNKKIHVLKDERNQQPIPSVWRQVLWNIVEEFKNGNFQLVDIDEVLKISPSDAERIAKNLQSYGAHLTSLPEEAWETSVCQWMGGYWDALIDLYTVEEGASDLAVFVRVYEIAHGYQFQVQSVHVP